MKTTLVLVLLTIALSSAAQSDSPIWKDRDGNPIPEIESQKASDGFSGVLLVTPDEDWQEKWDTPSDHTPHYNTATEVRVGGSLTTLIFFSNPMVDASGVANVVCDIRVMRPDGSISVELVGAECYRGPIKGNNYNIRMAGPALGFVGEPTDQLGEYITDVRLVDSVRKVELNLRTRFTLVEDEITHRRQSVELRYLMIRNAVSLSPRVRSVQVTRSRSIQTRSQPAEWTSIQ